jgi:hypothetical protein
VGGKGDRPSLENRWWVDQQKDSKGYVIEQPKIPLRFFRSGLGFDQDRAQRRLTDLNLKWFNEADPEPGGWAMLRMLEKERVPEPRVEKVKNGLPLPPNCRGILVDSGDALRAIITGQPTGERLIEVRLGQHCSFDAWVLGEWVREEGYRNFDEAMRKVPRLIREYLTTDRGAPIG